MRIGWREIRNRAKDFSKDWANAQYEKGDAHTFYNEFFRIFGLDRKKIAIFEKKVEMIDAKRRGFIDLLWPNVLLVEQKSAGKDLVKAQEQALNYVLGLKERDIPRFVLTCDFQRFCLLELETRAEYEFTLAQLDENVERFAFMLGVERRHYGKQAEVNITAAERLGTVRDGLEAKGYNGVDLEQLMVRLLFCLFADDTGIFESKDDFHFLLEERTDKDGNNVGRVLNEVFEILNTPGDKRLIGADPEFDKFPYVNGDLFKGSIRISSFDKKMRNDLLYACEFDWGKVSPATFGSLFQSVMSAQDRRKKGAHYTTEPNIMKLIGPLFLDELRVELEKLKARHDGGKRTALLKFQKKLSSLNFFDPACGCGNFLVVTYRELRKLELEALEIIHNKNSPLLLDVEAMSQVRLKQFYGIELEEFPAHIAEVAMWMTQHLANIELGQAYGKVFADIPLNDSANIKHKDALAIEWADVLPAKNCFAVMGNPPFGGAKYQAPKQRQKVRNLAALGKSGGTLDLVAAWFLSAGAYINSAENKATRIAFVATNSITQGEQVAQLWPVLFERYGLEISFAHQTFEWGSDARGKAHVHVVILGLTHRDHEPKEKWLFSYDDIKGEPDETKHQALSAYLFGADSVANRYRVVKSENKPINGAKKLVIGSKPIDGGHYIFTSNELRDFLEIEPRAKQFIRPYVGAHEFINNYTRYILALQDATPANIRAMPKVLKKVSAVKKLRLKSHSKPTQALASTPTHYHVTVIPESEFLVIPQVSSERRDYIPIGWLNPPVIPSDKLRVMLDADKWHFAILTSKMHMAWMRAITGRMKSDYMYSVGVVYNTFPWPEASNKQKAAIEVLAQAILDARESWPRSSLADLYDPDTMPGNLRKAHRALDKAVDRLYRKKPFDSDRDRAEHLFGLYEKLIEPMGDAAKQNKRVARNIKRRSTKPNKQ